MMKDSFVKKAEAQILKSGLRGWVAFNLDTRFKEVRPNDPEEEFAARASEIFETAQDTMETDTDGRNVIGLMLHDACKRKRDRRLREIWDEGCAWRTSEARRFPCAHG